MTRPRLVAVMAALAAGCAALAALSSCGGGDDDGAAGGTTPTVRVEQPKPAAAVVFVRARNKERTKSGTGFVYDARRGLILTSNHAVEASPAVTATSTAGQVLHGRVLARAQCHDFAVVELHPVPAQLHELRFADSAHVRAGQTLTSISYDAPTEHSDVTPAARTSYGRVSRVGVRATLHRLLPPMEPLIEHITPLGAAGSGSPLLNESGQVVGLNTLVGYPPGRGARDGHQYAMAGNEIYRLLRQLDEGPARTLRGWRAEHRCHRAVAVIAGVPFQRTPRHEDAPPEEEQPSGGEHDEPAMPGHDDKTRTHSP